MYSAADVAFPVVNWPHDENFNLLSCFTPSFKFECPTVPPLPLHKEDNMNGVYSSTPNIRPGPNDAYDGQGQPSTIPGGPPPITANNRGPFAPQPGTTQPPQQANPSNGSSSNETGQPFPELGRAGSLLGWVLDWVAPRSRVPLGPSAKGNLLPYALKLNLSGWPI